MFGIFHDLQLVCGQDLRSFVSKTYVRMWGTLACASGEDLLLNEELGMRSEEWNVRSSVISQFEDFILSHLSFII